MLAPSAHFAEAFRLFDAANREDPTLETGDDGQPTPKELLYAQRMTAWFGSASMMVTLSP